MRITIVDDNPEVLETYCDALSEYFECASFVDPKQALEHIRESSTDAILLDLHLPERSGFQLFEEIRRHKDVPILFLTGDGTLPSKLKGLEMGADDFITKPIETEELVARIRNRIRLAQKSSQQNKTIQFKDLIIDLDAHQVSVLGNPVKLTPKEYQLLLALAQNPNRVIHKDDLITMLWKDVHVEVNNLDTHFSNLRRKLKPFSNHVKTLKNLGYVLRI
jgi:DNA-binding response OmpR family regulator